MRSCLVIFIHDSLSDSCQSQLLPIVHDIYASFDQNPTLEVITNFLDKV